MNDRNLFSMIAAGAALAFSIGASAQALYVTPTGDVGIGTNIPISSLNVTRSDGTAQILVEETNTTVAPRTLFRLENPGNTKFGVLNTDAGVEWAFANPGTAFRLSRQGSGVVEMEIFNNGNVTIAGLLTENSDVNAKTKITDINPEEILSLVSRLPISQWEYQDAEGEKHIGPMAQDFYAAFGLGASETGISTIDTAGVALAAIKALREQNADLLARLEELERQQTGLQVMVATMIEAQQAAPVLTKTAMN